MNSCASVEGYTKVQNASYQVAAYLADEIAKLGPYEFICTGRPDEGIPAVCFKLKDGEDPIHPVRPL